METLGAQNRKDQSRDLLTGNTITAHTTTRDEAALGQYNDIEKFL